MPEPVPSAIVLSRPCLYWVAQPEFDFESHTEIPVAWLPEGSFFRAAGMQALQANGIAFYEVLSSLEEESIQRAVQAGIGITVMAEGTVPGNLRVIVRPSVLPRLGPVCIQLLESPDLLSDAAGAIRREILGQYPVSGFS